MKNLPILKWALIVGIVIVLNLFFNFAIKLVYDEPQWDKFCPQEQVTIQPKNQTECLSKGGAWTEAGYPINRDTSTPIAVKPMPPPTSEPAVTGWCDLNFTCNQEFRSASEVFNRNVFVVLVALGALSLVGGFLTTARSAVSLGLSFGGVVSLIIGTVRFWSDMDDYLRVIVLGVALIVLIWLGVKKIRE